MASAGSGTTLNGPAPRWEHLDRMQPVEPRSAGCKLCLGPGRGWTGLRHCLSCG